MRREVGPSFRSEVEKRLRARRVVRACRVLGFERVDSDLVRFRSRLLGARLPWKVVEEAVAIYGEAKKRVKGDKFLLRALKVAAVVKAARLHWYPLSLEQALKIFPGARRRLSEAFAVLEVKPADPALYVPSVVSRLPVGEKFKVQVLALRKVAELKMPGKKPQTVACLAVFLACRELGVKMPLKKFAELVGISPSSLRRVYREYSRFKRASPSSKGAVGGEPEKKQKPSLRRAANTRRRGSEEARQDRRQ